MQMDTKGVGRLWESIRISSVEVPRNVRKSKTGMGAIVLGIICAPLTLLYCSANMAISLQDPIVLMFNGNDAMMCDLSTDYTIMAKTTGESMNMVDDAYRIILFVTSHDMYKLIFMLVLTKAIFFM